MKFNKFKYFKRTDIEFIYVLNNYIRTILKIELPYFISKCAVTKM